MRVNSSCYEIVISDEVESLFDKYITTYTYEIEAGGILIGKIDDNEKKIIISDLSEPVADDKRTRVLYKRSEEGHQRYMDEVWEKSGHTVTYLGEWHTHNQHTIFPSPVDYSNWIKISKMRHNSDVLIFIILGRKDFAMWISHEGEIEKVI